FDPMLAKVIVHAPTRTEAALRLATVLERTRLQGLTCNRDFLVAALRHPAFLAGDTTTDFIARANPAPIRVLSRDELVTAAVGAALGRSALNRAAAKIWAFPSSGWRNTYLPWQHVAFTYRGEDINIRYHLGRDGVFEVRIDDVEQKA